MAIRDNRAYLRDTLECRHDPGLCAAIYTALTRDWIDEQDVVDHFNFLRSRK